MTRARLTADILRDRPGRRPGGSSIPPHPTPFRAALTAASAPATSGRPTAQRTVRSQTGIAKQFGAAEVFAAGRDTTRLRTLSTLGADQAITYDEIAAAKVDVVLDFVWGVPAAESMLPLLAARSDRSTPLTWVQIGSIAGDSAPIPSTALRAAQLQIVGSGIGSVSPRDFIAELPELAAAVTDGSLDVQARAVPLADIAQVWDTPTSERLVFVP
ncbi:hypothetical protein ABTY96_37155 [Streptomyces sp. NPDC096057]|uniref:hypothetical protein n=1 Tax=Streptomyces sp. NPDC096057 TaxID=3155543 RepID=UPI0033334DF7